MKFITGFVLLALVAMPVGVCAQAAEYKVTQAIPLGGEGSWDYLRVDVESQRLYIARSTRVMVVDLASGKLVGEIPDTAGVHGVALVKVGKRGVTSNGKADAATIFDLETLKPIAVLATGGKPDAILWEPKTRTVMTMNGRSNSISVIDPVAAKVVGTIALPGRPETAVSDEQGRVFVNLEDKAQIAQVDALKGTVTGVWDLAGCTEPTGLAIDLAARRLFTGCHSGVLIVVDEETGKNVAKLPIGNGVDAVGYDAARHLILTSNGEGSLSVIAQKGADSYANVQTVTTLPGAKTLALDPASHKVYTVANKDGVFTLLVMEGK